MFRVDSCYWAGGSDSAQLESGDVCEISDWVCMLMADGINTEWRNG